MTTLSWSVAGADSTALSGVTAVTGNSVNVAPATTTSYTLTIRNASETITTSITVVVNGSASIGSVTTDPSQVGIAIAPSFLGFSHEWSQAQVMGVPQTGVNSIYRQLLRNLMGYGNGTILIRIGGDSTDLTGEPGPGVVDAFKAVYEDTGARFILGVNLGSGDLQLATDQTKAYVAGMPPGSLAGIEIGNEPDAYYANGLRPPAYTFADFLPEFASWRSAILPLLPGGIKVVGPAWSTSDSLRNLPAFVSQEAPNLALITQHSYVADRCFNAAIPVDFLLQDTSATREPAAIAPWVPVAQQYNLGIRIGEMNSISCGGDPGVTDAFGSALWAADTMLEFAKTGVAGVNFHNTNGFPHAAFSFNITNTGSPVLYSVQAIHPLYYGMLFFEQLTANHAKLLPTTLTTTANLKAWVTIDDQGTVRVALINKDLSASGVVNIRIPGFGTATVTRLIAPSYQSTAGVTIAGVTFDNSVDGKPIGTEYGELVSPVDGTYTVAIPATSAALVTVPVK